MVVSRERVQTTKGSIHRLTQRKRGLGWEEGGERGNVTSSVGLRKAGRHNQTLWQVIVTMLGPENGYCLIKQ